MPMSFAWPMDRGERCNRPARRLEAWVDELGRTCRAPGKR
jgi:hypothetical protein